MNCPSGKRQLGASEAHQLDHHQKRRIGYERGTKPYRCAYCGRWHIGSTTFARMDRVGERLKRQRLLDEARRTAEEEVI